MSTPPPPHISGTDFVTLASRDLAASSEFFATTLGLRRSVYIADRHYSEFETGNLTLSIIDPAKMGREHRAGHNTIALHVDDVGQARATLEARGVVFHGDTFDTGVCHMAFFNDSEGNDLMLHSRYAPRVTEG